MLGKAFCAVAALQQESAPAGDPGQLLLQVSRLAGKNQRRECRQLLFDVGQSLPVRIVRHLLNWLLAPAVGRPTFRHYGTTPGFGRPYTRGRPQVASFSAEFGYLNAIPPRAARSSWLFRAWCQVLRPPLGALP